MTVGRLTANASPLYSALRADLLRRIRVGEFGVGEWLPSESELQKEYAMSQTPVRRALTELEQAGMIRRHQGRGSVVTSQEIVATTRMIGLGSELRERGHEVSVRVLAEPELAPPPEAAATALGLEPDVTAVRLDRMFLVDGSPGVLFRHYLAPSIPIQLGQLAQAPSLYTYLSECGASPAWAHESVSAGALDQDQADLLEQSAGTPVLIRERTSYAADDTPIEYATYWICAQGYSMALHLQSIFK
ncbi:MAG: GntR family transcriptional regulator [Bifidobacteriaceae bacterium]|jgi:GntR family transcriptional regulator|nr:GntR family transcriptional regulator [Bifidobacteriaceae bacterium]